MLKNRLLSAAACCLVFVGLLSQTNIIPTVYAQTQTFPRVFLLNPQILAANKAKIQAKDPSLMPAYNILINQANKLLTTKPVSVMDKSQTPPSGDKHDYMSMAPYLWPDPTRPNGLPYITRDGQTNPEVNSIPDRNNLTTVVNTVNTLSFAYYFSGDEKYSQHAVLFLKTWFIDPKTKMNPNLNYAQFAKGRNTGSSGGIIDAIDLSQIVNAIGLLDNSTSLTQTDKLQLHNWFRDYLQWLLTSKFGIQEGQQLNNHGTWYDVQIASIALYIGNNDLAIQTLVNDMLNRIPTQIKPDGEQALEIIRTKSWDYSLMNLRGLCYLAMIGNIENINLWHYHTKDGRSIPKAIDYLFKYATNQKQWPYQQVLPLNTRGLIGQLREASISLNNSTYWTESVKIEGKASNASIDNLKY